MTSRTVPEVLGGELVLGRSVTHGGAMAELVREGLPVKALFPSGRAARHSTG